MRVCSTDPGKTLTSHRFAVGPSSPAKSGRGDESGPLNVDSAYNRPFTYDLKDPLGQQVRSKMLSTYVRTRKGNCVSMPVLFLIVADRLGLKVRLAAAPLNPRDGYALVKKGTAMGEMIQAEFAIIYPTPALIPPTLRPRYSMLAAANEKAFRDAAALGWEPSS